MRNPFVNSVGGVVSADIAVPDHEREVNFYKAILSTGELPLWRDDLMNNQGTPIIGLGERTPEYAELPLQWMPHLQVADVATSVRSAIEMGGREIMHGKANDGRSLWACLADPDGAAFGVIPVVEDESNSSPAEERFGRISWLSLRVPDAAASRDFYEKVVGWNARAIEADDSEGDAAIFEMLIDDVSAAAEISQFRGEDESLQSVWLIHLPVDDFAESLRQVGQNGGEVVGEFPDQGYVVVRDPVGVFLALQETV